MRTLVLSDLHIGSKGCNPEEILALLKEEKADRYILVGDIIDGWLFKRYKSFTYDQVKVIRRFLKISKDKEIIWIAGNHDEFLRDYIGMTFGGIEIADQRLHEAADGKRYLVIHGDQFDMVVANPPFSLKDWGADKWATDPHKRALGGVPPATKGDFAWVQHMIASMKPETGRVGVVMPHGVLFRGSSEGAIRQFLIENDMLEAVIGLAPNLFYGTTIPACLLIFRATKSKDRKKHVLFVDGSKRFTKGKNQNELSESDVEDLFAAYKSNGTIEKTDIAARLVPHDEIAGNKWDLNIGRYLKTAAAEVVDVATALQELKDARQALAIAEQAMLERLKAAGYA